MLNSKFALLSVLVFAVTVFAARNPKLRGSLFEGDKFIPIPDFSDEFRGSFDHAKWYDINPRWKGRQPGLFAAKNVRQRNGKLILKGQYEGKNSNAFDGAPAGYQTYTTSFVQSRKSARYGYFEVKSKPGNSRLSSSFWGSLDTPTLWTEIDVYEIGGGARFEGIDFRRRINMNLHVFRDVKKGIAPNDNELSLPTYYVHNRFLRSKFNTYGLDWTKKHITWTFNGKAIRRERNKRRWRQPIPIKFDVETMPNWFGLPSRRTLPASYKIKYIRAWSRVKSPRSTSSVRLTSQGNFSQLAGHQFSNMFNLGTSDTSSPPANESMNDEEEEEEGEDNDEEESANLEVLPTEPQTDAPQDGLQRPPIPGSNEAVYRPVFPTLGRSWSDVINVQNSILDDIAGAQFGVGENIDLADFDEELTMFPGQEPAIVPASAPESDAGNDSEPETEAAAPAPEAAQTPAPVAATAPNTGSLLGNLLSGFKFGR